ncbi:hypothetical protein ES332_D02G074300v1 [Gossypium tomentosum]|uniref:Uncharacterized protein n=1 Tax=Gossypium tomentosum TaxID=34277 RepID=A0A5D2LU88_GOSTO|nr:hypothetical protein ES332_D02G074300v1 [Gossypium tomentosum]
MHLIFQMPQYDSNFGNTNSCVPMPIGTSSWYPESGATHHVCQNAFGLHTSTSYIDTGNFTATPSS